MSSTHAILSTPYLGVKNLLRNSYYNNKQQKYSLLHYYIALWHEQFFLKNGVYVQFRLGRMSSTHAILSTPVLRSEKFA